MFWVAIAVCVPFVYASSYLAGGGPPRAEGCSGEGAYEEGSGLTWLDASPEHEVGRDAFFTFHAEAVRMSPDAAIASIMLDVRDEGGNAVAGSTQLLRDRSSGPDRRELFVGWAASEARTGGETLTVTASAAGDFGTFDFSTSLMINAVDPELELPAFAPESWARITYGSAGEHECEGYTDDCSDVVRFGDEITTGYGVRLAAPPLATTVVVAWEYWLAALPGKGTVVELGEPFMSRDSGGYSSHARFGDTLDEYCVRVHGRDLKTGAVDSRDVCASPTPPFAISNEDPVGRCVEMPEDFEERWCAARSAEGSVPSSCDPFLPPVAGSGGAVGEPGSGGTGAGPGGTGAIATDGGTSGESPDSGGTGTGATGGNGATGGSGSGATGGTNGTPMSSDGAPGGAAGESGEDTSRVIRTNAGCGCRTTQQGASPTSALLLLLGLYAARRRRAGTHGQR